MLTVSVDVYCNGSYLGSSNNHREYPIVSKTLLIGAYRSGSTDDGGTGRYFKGTVNKAEIWNYAMSAQGALTWN